VRSPLECIAGRYEHAIFATYSLNLRFFEEWVLPLLREAGARNVIVLADEAQLGVALADRSLRSVGRSYHVVSVRLGPGAFHPKLFLLAGEDGTRACISSANLTVDGQLRNVESAIVLDSSVAEHREPLLATATFVRDIAQAVAPAHSAEAIMAALAAVEDARSARIAEVTDTGIRIQVAGPPVAPAERIEREGRLRAAALRVLREAGCRGQRSET
jgi:hypothetical protein